jgi:hypothetical protein
VKVPVLCAYQKCHETHPTISYTNCSHKIRKLVTNILQKKEKGKNRPEICSSLPVLSQLVIQFISFAGNFLLHYRSWNLLLHYEIAKKPLQKSYSILCTYIYMVIMYPWSTNTWRVWINQTHHTWWMCLSEPTKWMVNTSQRIQHNVKENISHAQTQVQWSKWWIKNAIPCKWNNFQILQSK